jgi:hypothetical protein
MPRTDLHWEEQQTPWSGLQKFARPLVTGNVMEIGGEYNFNPSLNVLSIYKISDKFHRAGIDQLV